MAELADFTRNIVEFCSFLNIKAILLLEIYFFRSNILADNISREIKSSKFAVQKSLEKTEILYKSLMQAYFG